MQYSQERTLLPTPRFHCVRATRVRRILPMILQFLIIGHQERIKIFTRMSREFLRSAGCHEMCFVRFERVHFCELGAVRLFNMADFECPISRNFRTSLGTGLRLILHGASLAEDRVQRLVKNPELLQSFRAITGGTATG
jgi:hypothetical protein